MNNQENGASYSPADLCLCKKEREHSCEPKLTAGRNQPRACLTAGLKDSFAVAFCTTCGWFMVCRLSVPPGRLCWSTNCFHVAECSIAICSLPHHSGTPIWYSYDGQLPRAACCDFQVLPWNVCSADNCVALLPCLSPTSLWYHFRALGRISATAPDLLMV